LAYALECLIENSDRFRDFLLTFLDKIKKKVKDAKRPQELDDLVFELETGYSLGLDESRVEYEKYGKGNFRSPDYTVHFRGRWEFNVEVRHLQEALLGKACESVIEDVRAQTASFPPGFVISLYMPSDLSDYGDPGLNPQEAEENREFIRRYTSAKEAIIQDVRDKINEYEQEGRTEPIYYPIKGFEKEINLLVTRLTSNPDGQTILTHSRPRFYINTESLKFCEAICQKLGQMIAGMQNILVIRSAYNGCKRRCYYLFR
jgi:hypothetical protein